jgi:hypothetical protein
VSFPKVVEEVESPNSWSFDEKKLHEMPFILGINSPMPHLLLLHVIFYLNLEFSLPHASIGGGYQRAPFCTIVLSSLD